MRYLLATALAAASAAALSYSPVPNGVLVSLPNGLSAVLAVEGLTSFRFSIVNGTAPLPIATSMVAPKSAYAPFTVAQSGSVVTLTAPSLGAISIDAASGALALADAAGAPVTHSTGAALGQRRDFYPSISPHLRAALAPRAARNDTCAQRFPGEDVTNPQRSAAFPNGLKGATEDSCCAACNSDPTCISWVWSDGSRPDPAGNCWPLSGYSGTTSTPGRVLGGFAPPPPPPPPGSTVLTLSASAGARFYGSGADGGGAQALARTGAQAQVGNTASWTPSLWSSDGWGALIVSPFPNTAPAGSGQASNQYPVKWAAVGGGVEITVLGGDAQQPVDFYLYPAATMKAFVQQQAGLEGRAAVPPRYAMGFLACRWGWTNQSYIESVLSEFRELQAPIDAFISDFEWFTARPDYSLPSNGDPDYHDFSYNNITFPPPAAALISRYRSQYNFRFGGIRKPRLGNSALLVFAQSKGWLMGQGGDPSGKPNGSRNINYSMPDLFDWYSQQNAQYLQDGVQFFWVRARRRLARAAAQSRCAHAPPFPPAPCRTTRARTTILLSKIGLSPKSRGWQPLTPRGAIFLSTAPFPPAPRALGRLHGRGT